VARIILTIVFLVALAVLIILNIGATAAVNVFGWTIEELSVTVVALVGFVAGVLYSFIFYFMSYIERGRRERLARRKQKLKNQEEELKSREQKAGELESESRRRLEASSAALTPDATRQQQGLFSGLFGRRQKDPVERSTETAESPAEPATRGKR
jgi:cell shape-determining protein MreC